MKKALSQFDRKNFNVQPTRYSLFRVLKIAEHQGWQWGHREVYGGGNEIELFEAHTEVALLFVDTDGVIKLTLNKEYFKADFQPKQLAPYNAEIEAELRNEEALYGYELPRPWNRYK